MSKNISMGKQIVDLSKEGYEEGMMESEVSAVVGTEPIQTAAAPAFGPVVKLPNADLGRFLQRMTKLNQYTLASTDTAEAQIVASWPIEEFFNNASVIEKVNNFNLLRGTFEVEIVVTAPPGAYGSYVVVASPVGTSLEDNDFTIAIGRFDTIFQQPHILIDLSKSNNLKLTMPWIWNMDYATVGEMLSGGSAAHQWRFRIFCLTPITMGNGSLTPTAKLTVYGRYLEDFELIIPRRQGFDDMREGVNTALGQKPSGIAAGVAGAAGALSMVPVIGPFAGVVAAGASAVSTVLDWFGFTRTTSQQTPTVFIQRNFSNLANVDVEDTSEVAALFKNNAISIDRAIIDAIPEDEASFASIFAKWTYVGRSTLTQTMATGDEVCAFPVTPFLSHYSMESSNGASMTAAGYVGFPFQYWRGGMEFKFVIPVSQFHRGALQVAWYPDASVSAQDVTNITYNHVIDLSASQETNVSVGYVDEYPALLSEPKLYGSLVVSSTNANGIIRITVVNPLICNVSTANTSVHVFARACGDMQFSVPRQVFKPLMDDGSLGSITDFKTGFICQAKGTIGDTDSIEANNYSLVPSGAPYPLRDVCFGEDIRSVRALMQKFSHDKYISKMVTEVQPVNVHYLAHLRMAPIASQYLQYRSVTDDGPDFTWMGYYMIMYTGVAASVRYKIINTGDTAMGMGVSAQDELGGSSSASIGTLNHVNLTDANSGFEVSVPYYYRKKYITPTQLYTASNVYLGTKPGRNDLFAVVSKRGDDDSAKSVAAYSALGPDIRLGMFCSTKAIKTATGDYAPLYGGDYWVAP